MTLPNPVWPRAGHPAWKPLHRLASPEASGANAFTTTIQQQHRPENTGMSTRRGSATGSAVATEAFCSDRHVRSLTIKRSLRPICSIVRVRSGAPLSPWPLSRGPPCHAAPPVTLNGTTDHAINATDCNYTPSLPPHAPGLRQEKHNTVKPRYKVSSKRVGYAEQLVYLSYYWP
jgi:hypothetical protein